MSCKKLHKNLIFFVEKELPEKEMIKIQNHLLECSECAAFAEELKKSIEILETEKIIRSKSVFYTRVKAKIELQSDSEKTTFWQPVFTKNFATGIFSILLIAGIYTGIKIGQPVSGNSISVENADSEIIPYLNEMKTEPIEGFLME